MATDGNSNALNVSVLGAAKEMYIKQLKIVLTPLIHEGFVSLWEDAQKKEDDQGGYNYLKQFQIFLKDIPNWNQTILEEETRRVLGKVDFLMELVTAVFVSHVKILASVRLGGKNRNIRIKVPNAEVFIHTVYTNAAEMIYYNPYVFQNHVEREHYEKIRDLIEKSVDETIDSMIPIESVLKEYLSNVFSGHIKAPPISLPAEEPIGNLLSGSDIGLPLDDNMSIDNPSFGTGNDPFANPFPSTSSSAGDKLSSVDPFGGSDDFFDNNDNNESKGSSSDPFSDSSDPFGPSGTSGISGTSDPFGSSGTSEPSETSEFGSSEPSGTSDPFGSSEPSGTSEPSDPFGSSEPSEPSETSDPFGSNETSEPSDPFGPSEPSGSSDPFGPSETSETSETSEASDPFGTGSSGSGEDPFGTGSGGTSGEDPFGSGGTGDSDPFGGTGDSDPFGSSSSEPDPFSSNPDDVKII